MSEAQSIAKDGQAQQGQGQRAKDEAAHHAAMQATHPVTQLTGPALLEELDRLRAEVAQRDIAIKALESRKSSNSSIFKVSVKGALSVYGLGRFPVTLYRSQWVRLLSQAEAIKAFMAANEASLASKEGKDA